MYYDDFELKSQAEIIEFTKNRKWRKKVFVNTLDEIRVSTRIESAKVELLVMWGGSYKGDTIYNLGIRVNGQFIWVEKYDVIGIERLVIQWLRRYDIDNATICVISNR